MYHYVTLCFSNTQKKLESRFHDGVDIDDYIFHYIVPIMARFPTFFYIFSFFSWGVAIHNDSR